MGGVDARADEAVLEVVAGGQRGFHVRTVVGIDVHRAVGSGLFRGLQAEWSNFDGTAAAVLLLISDRSDCFMLNCQKKSAGFPGFYVVWHIINSFPQRLVDRGV